MTEVSLLAVGSPYSVGFILTVYIVPSGSIASERPNLTVSLFPWESTLACFGCTASRQYRASASGLASLLSTLTPQSVGHDASSAPCPLAPSPLLFVQSHLSAPMLSACSYLEARLSALILQGLMAKLHL